MHYTGKLLKAIHLAIAVSLVLLVSPWWLPPRVAAQSPAVNRKVSSRLDMQVREKNRLAAAPGRAQARTAAPQAARAPAGDVSRQGLFLHMKEFPTPARQAELRALGAILYPGSWIPPVGRHATGFMYAEAAVDRIQGLAARDYVSFMETAEARSKPKNDLSAGAMNVNYVWNNLGYTGAGIKVAVLDSGLDVGHPDIPATIQKADYSAYNGSPESITYGSVANTFGVTDHGTHVTGSVVGRGTQSSAGLYVYKGTAPGASLIFLKIGRSSDAEATVAAQVQAIKDAVDVYKAKVITLSYGDWSTFHDGTSEVSQAVDYAAGKGAVFFAAAGNEALDGVHYSGTAPAGGYSEFIRVNASAPVPNSTYLAFNLVWFDGPVKHNPLSLEYYVTNNPGSRILTIDPPEQTLRQAESPKGTESVFSRNTNPLPAGGSFWYLRVKNDSSDDQFFHIYVDKQWNTGGNVVFDSPDQSYTLSDPAEADGAIAVGAYVTRTTWTNYMGQESTNSGQSVGSIASFSSRGPRVDAAAPGKPNVVAPGSLVISLRDRDVYPSPNTISISNNGVNNGSGPADYVVKQGTSMAAPLAAGVAALLLSKNPTLTPAQVRSYLETTAVDKGAGSWDNVYGWGLINAQAAMNAVSPRPPITNFTKTLSPASGLAPNVVTFTDTSIGAQTWSWDFGDGMGSSSQNPTKTYSVPGNYTVTLTAASPSGPSSASQTVNIYSAPVAGFTKVLDPVNGVLGASPVIASFTDVSSGNIVSWSWNFGDGTGSSSQNPTKTYSSTGNHTVTLTVTNPLGSNSASQTVSVYGIPAASFTAFPTSTITGALVTFTDSSTGNITGWLWNFGDDTTSTAQHPTHRYTGEGNYSVNLTVANPAGSSGKRQDGYITIVDYQAQTSLILGASPLPEARAYIGAKVNRFFHPGTGNTGTLPDGIGSFDARVTYNDSQIRMVAGNVSPPFSGAPAAGANQTTVTGVTGAYPGAQPPFEFFRLNPIITASRDTPVTVTLRFNSIGLATTGSPSVPQSSDAVKSFLRGDSNNDGHVDSVDALFIAQFRVGIRGLGETAGLVNPINAATVKNDSPSSGAVIDIADALFISQMRVGMRDAFYVYVP
ncbi:MAG: S8 family serine peptidase [Chloroflexi bacterium]|nr:S8 family serine peptidase [Chloroflexota bacterium]